MRMTRNSLLKTTPTSLLDFIYSALGSLIISFLFFSVSYSIFLNHYFDSIVIGQSDRISTQEWREVENSLNGGWLLIPEMEDVCIYNSSYILVGAGRNCVPSLSNTLLGRSLLTSSYGFSFVGLLRYSYLWISFIASIAFTLFLLLAQYLLRSLTYNRAIDMLDKVIGNITVGPGVGLSAEEELIRQNAEFLISQETDSTLEKISIQIAHDIRSPLSALNAVLRADSVIDKRYESLIIKTIHRLSEIVDTLHHYPKEILSSTSDEICDVSAAIQQIVEEKKVLLPDNIKLIYRKIDSSTNGVHCPIKESILLRVLSNLVDNSINSIETSIGLIEINLSLGPGIYLIEIKDNGRGIPKHILENLGKYRISEGKRKVGLGLGIGFKYVTDSIQSAGGELDIVSEVGKGTNISIRLPI